MKINPIYCGNVHYYRNNSTLKKSENLTTQPLKQPSFNGKSGAIMGAKIGLIWGAAMVGMCAVAAPYLLPAIAGELLVGGAGAGALAGHLGEEEHKG